MSRKSSVSFFERILQVWRGAIIHSNEYCAFVSATLLQFPPFTSKTTCNISMKAFWCRKAYSDANYNLQKPASQSRITKSAFIFYLLGF